VAFLENDLKTLVNGSENNGGDYENGKS